MLTFGQRLRETRLSRGWSQRTLTYHCGVGQALISQYEQDKYDPTIWNLLAIADALKVSTDYLLKGEESWQSKAV